MDKIDKSIVFSKAEAWILLQITTETVQNDPSDYNAAALARKLRIHLGVSKE